MESQTIVIRDFTLDDLERVKEIHGATHLDFRFPDLASPLFFVSKVACFDGIVRQCVAGYIQCECYLFSDPGDWADPATKLATIKELDRVAMHEVWLKGVDCCCLWLPPGMERFGERLVADLGFQKDRDGWVTFSKRPK
jgi:hypothetical protein